MICDRFRSHFLYVCILFILDGNIYGINGAVIGWTEKARVGSEVCVEVDLRSSKKEERRIRFIVNRKIQKCVIVGVGNKIRYGVWNNNPIFLFTYISLIYHSHYIIFIILYYVMLYLYLFIDLID